MALIITGCLSITFYPFFKLLLKIAECFLPGAECEDKIIVKSIRPIVERRGGFVSNYLWVRSIYWTSTTNTSSLALVQPKVSGLEWIDSEQKHENENNNCALPLTHSIVCKRESSKSVQFPNITQFVIRWKYFDSVWLTHHRHSSSLLRNRSDGYRISEFSHIHCTTVIVHATPGHLPLVLQQTVFSLVVHPSGV